MLLQAGVCSDDPVTQKIMEATRLLHDSIIDESTNRTVQKKSEHAFVESLIFNHFFINYILGKLYYGVSI